jgi:hypothetical protein
MATTSSHSPHASRPSTFRVPGWGALALLSSCRRWRNATSRKLVPFSHRSASRIFIILAGAESEASRGLPSRGLASRLFQLLGVETILQLYGGGVPQPCRGRQTVAAQLGCNIPSSILAFVARTGVRTCRCALGRPALAGAVLVDAAVGADVVAAGESFSADKPVSATRGPTSDSLALMSGSRPLSGDANESLLAAASVLGPLLLLQRSLASHQDFVVPQALQCGGLFVPAGVEPEFRL